MAEKSIIVPNRNKTGKEVSLVKEKKASKSWRKAGWETRRPHNCMLRRGCSTGAGGGRESDVKKYREEETERKV